MDLICIKSASCPYKNDSIHRVRLGHLLGLKIKMSEIEVANIDELKTVIKFKPKRIMLDNFNIANIKKSVQIIRDNSKCQIEVSGKMTINRIKKIKYLDIDFVSVGKITHSACFLDISMLVVE